MDAINAKAVSEGTKTNDYQIFREMVREPSHGRVLGIGIGIKAKDVYCHAPNPIPGFVTMTGMLISSLNLILTRTNLTL